MRQMDTVYASICGAITLDDSNHSPLGGYENIVDTATYVQGWDEMVMLLDIFVEQI